MRRVSFWGPRHAGMEGPQTRRHDGAQRRKILIMGPSAAGMTGPSAAVGPQRSLNSVGSRECDYSVRGGLLAVLGKVIRVY